MFCPNCSEPKLSDATQFCKRCGLDLFGLSEFIESGEGGVVTPFDRRRKGLKQGVGLLAIGIVLMPVWMFIGAAFPPNDRLVESAPSTTVAEAIAWIGMWIAFLAGAVRVAYALLFESKRTTPRITENEQFKTSQRSNQLPSADYFRPADPGGWKTSGELFEKVKARHHGEL